MKGEDGGELTVTRLQEHRVIEDMLFRGTDDTLSVS